MSGGAMHGGMVSRRCKLDIITRHNGKAHVVFGHSYEGQCVTYCGLRWWNGHSPTPKQTHCKNCTRELRKAGMSWRWFEVQQFEAPNGHLDPLDSLVTDQPLPP